MRVVQDTLTFSATDLSSFLACTHLSLLDRRSAFGGPKPPKFPDPALEALRQRGFEHERAFLSSLDGNVIDIGNRADAFEATREAMRAGAEVIYQGALKAGDWIGRPDFLRKVGRPSRLGDWSYEVIDAKLAREAKGGALLQLLVYADLLKHVQGVAPESVHLALGGPDARTVSFRVADYAAYFRSLRRRFMQHMNAGGDPPIAPDPTAHCDVCDWQTICQRERRQVDHLSLVAGIRKQQVQSLREVEITSVVLLSEVDLQHPPMLERVRPQALQRIREQARIQVEGRREGIPKYELLLPIEPGQGLAALPPPSPGDLFFDLEGDPYAFTYGIEYLFGFADSEGRYTGRWAMDPEAEKRAFEAFIDLVMARLEEYPDLHVYHFAPYEPSALKRLMGRHATREEELDRLLRGEVFVDLYRVVKQALRASVESYSIKKLEPFYGFERAVDLRKAGSARASHEALLELGQHGADDAELLNTIEGYNQDDCVSTLRLRNWLEQLRDELAQQTAVPRPERASPEPPEKVAETETEVAALVAALTSDVPDDPAAPAMRADVEQERSPEQQARWLLAQLLGFHRREQKASWWEYFRRRDLSSDELIEDQATLGGLTYETIVGHEKRSLIHRYRFPHQEHGLKIDDQPHDPQTGKAAGTIVAIDDASGTIDLKRGSGSSVPHPGALIPNDIIGDKEQRASLRRVARAVLDSGLGDDATFRAAADLLMRRAPRVGLEFGDESLLDVARRLVHTIDRSILPVQGPPGAGKTFTGARMIVEALKAGKRVGITAMSHKVICNLLDEVSRAAREEIFALRGIQKAKEGDGCGSREIRVTNDNADVLKALQSGEAHLAAGTAWLWSREDMIRSVDLLFIDEAGQFSLADALAVAPAANSLVLLGDPKQLDRPQQGSHPPGADVSALSHLLGEHATMPPERGLFLGETWRLHPEICLFTSELFYDRRLRSRAGREMQRVIGPDPLNGSGLRFVPVEHEGNVSESPEEIEVVARLIEDALDARATWVNEKGEERPLRLADILVVAPYNAQVAAIAQRLPAGARVGTVDKFQGQQAAIVIYSMATSSAEEAPRGMEFLFSPNRLNVATSRAQALAVIVANPSLFEPDCRTPEQMRLANAFCRFAELASLPEE